MYVLAFVIRSVQSGTILDQSQIGLGQFKIEHKNPNVDAISVLFDLTGSAVIILKMKV